MIDLTFATGGISDSVLFWGPIERWALTQDHIPIEIHLQRRADAGATPESRPIFRLDKAN